MAARPATPLRQTNPSTSPAVSSSSPSAVGSAHRAAASSKWRTPLDLRATCGVGCTTIAPTCHGPRHASPSLELATLQWSTRGTPWRRALATSPSSVGVPASSVRWSSSTCSTGGRWGSTPLTATQRRTRLSRAHGHDATCSPPVSAQARTHTHTVVGCSLLNQRVCRISVCVRSAAT